MNTEELIENFQLLGSWEDRYMYLIELGNALEPMTEADKIPENKVEGCTSQVWMKTTATGDVLTFVADSDAHIVRGLIAVLQILLSGKTKAEILSADIPSVFEKLGLSSHLSPTRRNGFFAMVGKLRHEAGLKAD